MDKSEGNSGFCSVGLISANSEAFENPFVEGSGPLNPCLSVLLCLKVYAGCANFLCARESDLNLQLSTCNLQPFPPLQI